MPRILGIDPGSNITGFGIIDTNNNKFNYVTSGCIKPVATNTGAKLKVIYDDLSEIINYYKPDVCGIEDIFVHLNPRGSLKLGQARGVALLACANFGLIAHEYSPRKVKQSVVGYGNADKRQVQDMVTIMLNLNGRPQEDAADALGVAICAANLHNQVLLG